MNKKGLEEYLDEQRKRLSVLSEEVGFLEQIKIPLVVVRKELRGIDGLQFYSEDYKLATDFTIEKRTINLPSQTVLPNGSLNEYRILFYPQFYFMLDDIKNISGCLNGKSQVLVQHAGYEEDENIAFRIYNVTKGTKDYKDKNNVVAEAVSLKKVLNYFADKGVKKGILEDLERHVEKYGALF